MRYSSHGMQLDRKLHRRLGISRLIAPPPAERSVKCAIRILLISILCLSLVDISWGQDLMESHEKFVCTSGPIKKIISIYNISGASGPHERGACRVDYTDGRRTRTLWSSNSERAFCTTKALSLVTKLIQGNYSCKPESVGVPKAADSMR
jgi:hypothetical protein